MADFPTLGLNFDLTEIVVATRKLEAAKSGYLELGGASQEAAKEAEVAANRVVTAAKKLAKAVDDAKGAARGRGGRPPKTAEEIQMEAITKAIGEKSRFWKQRSAEQLAAERAAAAEEQAIAQRTTRAMQDALNFRMRLTKQRGAEAIAAEKAAAQASDAAEAEIRRNAQTTFDFRMRMARQRAAEEAQLARTVAAAEKAAMDRAAAEAKIDADMERTLAERNAQFRTDQIKRIYAEEDAARSRHLADMKADAELERRLVERNMDFRAQRIIQQGAGGGGRGGGIIANMFGAGDGGRAAGFTGVLGSLNSAVGRVRTSFLNARFAVAAFLGALTVGPLINILDTMTALQARVTLYAAKASDVPFTFEALYKTAQDARQPLEGIATLYTRLAPLAEQLGKSQMQLLNVTKTVAQSFAIGGASAAESASSSQQLAQALAANRLGGDELRSLAENAPVLLQMIAKSLNMNSAQFIKWAHDGKASASVVVNAIEAASGKIDDMFKRFPVTIGQSITLVSNAFAHLVDRVNVATGASTRIATEIAKLAEFMGRQSTIDAFTASVNNLGKAMAFVGSVIKGVVDYLPAIGAGLLTIAAASAAPAVMTSLATAITAVGIAFTGASGRALVFSQALTASSRGVAGLVAALGGMAGIITGGVVIAIALLVAGLVRIKKAQEEANNAAANYGDAQQGAIAALQRASSFAETYSINASSLNKTLLEVATSNRAAATGSDTATAANKAALEMANARAEAERALTVSILRRAAADAGKNANEADRSINGFLGVRDQLQIGRRLASPEAVAKAEKQIKDVEAVVNKERALQEKLSKNADALEKADLKVTVPEGSGKPLATTTDPTKGVDGAINRIARLRAEVEGLVAQINALSSDPLSDFSARINAAGEEAAAQYTAGKAKGFAETARQLAQQKEEATIRLQLTQQLTQQTRAQKDEAAQVAVATAARERATSAMTAYWTSGNRTAEGYAQALRLQADAETTGAIRAEQLRLAQEYGVATIDEIAAAYQKATGASEADSKALQDHVLATAAATEATIRQTQAEKEAAQASAAASERQQAIADLEDYAKALVDGTVALSDYNRQLRIRAALQAAGPAADPKKVIQDTNDQISKEDTVAREERRRALDDELRIAAMAAEQREIEAEAMARVDEAMKRGSQSSQELDLAWQRIQVATEQSQRNVAALQGRTKDAVRDAFLDTGRLNFKPLGDALKQQLRKALYDAWLAKPIQIVVDAIIRTTKQGQDRLEDQVRSMADQLKNSDLGKWFADVFKKGASVFGDTLRKLLGRGGSSLSEFAGNTSAGYQTGAAVADALGVQGSGSHPTWQKVMDIGAAAIGNALGGPVGAAIATFISRTLGKVLLGKNSNNGAIASFNNGVFTGVLSGDKRNAETSELATSAATAITQGVTALRGLGANLTTTVSRFDIGTRDTTHIDFTGGQHLETARGDAEAAVQASLLLIARSATFGDEAMQRFVDRIENSVSTIDDLITKIEAFKVAMDFRTSVSDSVLQYTDPREYALSSLRDTQVKRRQQAAAYNAEGFYSTQEYAQLQQDLSQLEQLEIAELLNKLATGLDGAAASLEKLKEAQDDLAKYLQGLLTSDLSPLSPKEQLSLSASKFNDLLAKANGGDLEAFNNLTAASDEYLSAAQKFYGGTEAYAAIFDRVYQQLSALSTREFEDPVVSAIEQQTQLLIDAINQVVEAIGGEGGGAAGGGTGAAGADWGAYLQQNPDVVSEYNRLSKNNLKNNYGINSVEEFAAWHYQNYGKTEGRTLPMLDGATGATSTTSTAAAATPYGAANTNAAGLTDAQVAQIVAALQDNANQVTSQIAASTEAQVGTVASGLGGLTDATIDATATARALSGGQVRTQAA